MTFNYHRYGSYVGTNTGVEDQLGVTDTKGAYITYSTGLYDFTSFTFSRVTTTGMYGPTLSALLANYDTSTYPWLNDTNFFNTDANALGTGTEGIQIWQVPTDGVYNITARGAKGGNVTGTTTDIYGGIGAEISADFTLEQGTLIEILVGHDGQTHTIDTRGGAGGGGGGTYVVKRKFVASHSAGDNSDIYVIAGGGGGAEQGVGSWSGRHSSTNGGNGLSGQFGGNSSNVGSATSYGGEAPNYTTGSYGSKARGGANGYGGGGSVGGGGGGFFNRGGFGNSGTSSSTPKTWQAGHGYWRLSNADYSTVYRSKGGNDNASGTAGVGGFGGGGGCQSLTGYGGGGGGYSGGGAGNWSGGLQGNGGGGGSYYANGSNVSTTVFTDSTHPKNATANNYNAFVTITLT